MPSDMGDEWRFTPMAELPPGFVFDPREPIMGDFADRARKAFGGAKIGPDVMLPGYLLEDPNDWISHMPDDDTDDPKTWPHRIAVAVGIGIGIALLLAAAALILLTLIWLCAITLRAI